MNFSIFNNYKIKLASFVFAFFIWFLVITENEYEHIIYVKMVTANLPDNKVILSEVPEKVKIKIRGTGKDLIGLMLGRGGWVELDLTDVERGKKFDIEPRNVMFSRAVGNIEATEIIMPDSVNVVLDDFYVKKVPIKSSIKTKASLGYTIVGDVQITPDSVTITGPRSMVSQVTELPTIESEFSDLRFDLKKTLPLHPPLFEKVTMLTNEVEIYLNVQKIVEVTMSGIPIEVQNVPGDKHVRVVPSTLSLVIEGGGDLLTQVNREDIKAYIDYNRVKDSPATRHAAYIDSPEGISYRDVEPSKFRLVFENRSSN